MGRARAVSIVVVSAVVSALVAAPAGAAPAAATPVDVSIELSDAAVAQGEAVVATASVLEVGGVGAAGGTIRFAVDGAPGESVAVVNGRAMTRLNGLATGSHRVTAAYTGDSGHRDGDAGEGATAVVVPAGSSRFVPLAPQRLLDTRQAGGKPGDGGVVDLPVTDRVGARDVTAVTVTVTATETTAAGFVTAWPAGAPRPLASNLNVPGPGATVAGTAVVPVSTSGRLSVFTQTSAHLVVDITGYFTAAATATAGRVVPVAPARLLDTRPGATQVGYTGPSPAAGATVQVQVAGRGGVPEGATAALVSITATDAAAAGFVTAYPSGPSRPESSTLNVMGAGETVANAAWVSLSADGKLSLYTLSPLDLLLDVSGWVTGRKAPAGTAGLFVPTAPTRLLDTRPAGPQVGHTGPKPGAGSTVTVALAGRGPLPAHGVAAVVGTLTAAESTGPGFVTAHPAGQARPATSSLNLTAANQVRSNLTTTPMGAGGISVFTQASAHLIFDVSGFFTTDLAPPQQVARRQDFTLAPGTTALTDADVTAVAGDDTARTVTVAAAKPVPAVGDKVVLTGPRGVSGAVTAVSGRTLTLAPRPLDTLFSALDARYSGPIELTRQAVEFTGDAFQCDSGGVLTQVSGRIRFDNTHVDHEHRAGSGTGPSLRLVLRTEMSTEFTGTLDRKAVCRATPAFLASNRITATLPGAIPVTVDLTPVLRFETATGQGFSFTESHHRTLGVVAGPDLVPRTINNASRTGTVPFRQHPGVAATLGADAAVRVLGATGFAVSAAPRTAAVATEPDCAAVVGTLESAYDLRLDRWFEQAAAASRNSVLGPWTVRQQCRETLDGPLQSGGVVVPPASAGRDYRVTLVPKTARYPLTWTATGLPPWLRMSPNGELHGTPSDAGTTAQFTVDLVDADGARDSQVLRIEVGGPSFAARVVSPAPQARVWSPVAEQLVAAGGQAPFRWTTTGTTPTEAGLSVDGSGRLTGTPRQVEPITVHATVTDAHGRTAPVEVTVPVAFGSAPPINGTLTRLTAGNAHSSNQVISTDGKWVAFLSTASDLTADPDPSPGSSDVFLTSLETGTTRRITDGRSNPTSTVPAISADGSVIAFTSSSTQLVPGPDTSPADVYVHNRLTATTTRIASGTEDLLVRGMSPDGTVVAWSELARLHLTTIATGATTEVTSPTSTRPTSVTFAADNRTIAYGTTGVTPGAVLTLRTRDLATGAETDLGVAISGTPAISADGRRIVYNTARTGYTGLSAIHLPGREVEVLDDGRGPLTISQVPAAGACVVLRSTLPTGLTPDLPNRGDTPAGADLFTLDLATKAFTRLTNTYTQGPTRAQTSADCTRTVINAGAQELDPNPGTGTVRDIYLIIRTP